LRLIPRPPSQTWKTFLRNHAREIVSTDFFTVPTVNLRVMFVFLVLVDDRRRVLHFGITEHPTSGWVAQQIMEPLPTGMQPDIRFETAMEPMAKRFGNAFNRSGLQRSSRHRAARGGTHL